MTISTKALIDLETVLFVPLSEVKAKLSEWVRRLVSESKRLVITINGRPNCVILPYQDYIRLLKAPRSDTFTSADEKIINFDEWEKDQKRRNQVRDSILKLFDPSKLSRKGQKTYKQRTVRELG